MAVRILTGDCREVLTTLDSESIDACVCDPPYNLTDIGRKFQGKGGTEHPHGRPNPRSEKRRRGFMGEAWDGTGVAFDPATWEAIKRVLKPGAYLVAFGGTRTYHRMVCAIEDAGFEIKDCLCWLYGSGMPKHTSLLKPAWEPIVLAKKRGAGSLNRDACRIIATPEDIAIQRARTGGEMGVDDGRSIYGAGRRSPAGNDLGRWPANVILDEVAAAMLDAEAGERKSSGLYQPIDHGPNGNPHATNFGTPGVPATMYGDSGGPSRFFYCPKVDDDERNRGLPIGMVNDHPTVKPASLMQWLVKLVTLPGQTVVDPFCGSGTTGIACDREGVDFVGIDLSEHYADIARHRIRGDCPMFANVEVAS